MYCTVRLCYQSYVRKLLINEDDSDGDYSTDRFVCILSLSIKYCSTTTVLMNTYSTAPIAADDGSTGTPFERLSNCSKL